MKLYVIINKSTKDIEGSYMADLPQQAMFAGDWGNSDICLHKEVPSGMDAECIVSDENYNLSVDSVKTATKSQAQQMQAIQRAVEKAITFGHKLITKFAAENMAMGITQDGKTAEVRVKMSEVISALMTGSLYDAIAQAEAITDFDEKYVTAERVLNFINQIQDYLGIPRS